MSRSELHELEAQYEKSFAPILEYRRQVWQILIRSYFQKLVGADKIVLDLGCGWGEFIASVQAKKKFAMDSNPSAREHLSDEVIFLAQDSTEPWRIDSSSLDIVFTSNFFEHLASKEQIRSTLYQAHTALKRGGRIICMGPNIRYVHGAYWDFFDHFIPLTDFSMAEALEMTGFKVEMRLSRFIPYTMIGISRPPLWFVRLYVQFPLLWRVLGGQFVVVGRKR